MPITAKFTSHPPAPSAELTARLRCGRLYVVSRIQHYLNPGHRNPRGKGQAMKPEKSTHPAKDKLDAVGMDEICARTADCVPMRTIAADIGVSWATLNTYISATPERIEQYARAREAQADKLAEDILAIADDGMSDVYLDADGNERTNQEVIARSRLRVDARKWLAGKMAPKKYGDKLDIDAKVDGKLVVEIARFADTSPE